MPMLRTIERPTKATLRPWACAASRTCWMRCTWLAKLDTMTRRGAVRKTCSIAGVELALGGGEAGHLGVGGVDEEQVDALLAQPGEGAQVGDPLVERELVHLEVAGVQHQAGRGADRDRQPVGDRVVDGHELAVERAERAPVALRRPRRSPGLIRCSLSFASMNARVSFEPTSGMSARSRSRYGTPPMWSSWPWVSTIADDVVEAIPDPGEVRQDHVDAGLVSPRGTAPRSRRSSSCPACSKTVMLRPISPSPPSATIRRPPFGQGRRRAKLRVRMAHSSTLPESRTRRDDRPRRVWGLFAYGIRRLPPWLVVPGDSGACGSGDPARLNRKTKAGSIPRS